MNQNHPVTGGEVHKSQALGSAAAIVQRAPAKTFSISVGECIAQFADAMLAAGLTPPSELVGDGVLRRFPTNNKPRDLAGWYVLHLHGLPAGRFGCWRAGINETWCADIGRSLSASEAAAHRARVSEMRRQHEADRARVQSEAATRAAAIWEAAQPAADSHPYLVRKNIRANGLRAYDGRLVVPLRNGEGMTPIQIYDGEDITSLQFIDADGRKQFMTGGRVRGSSFGIGDYVGEKLLVCEGIATAATLHTCTGYPVVAAFSAGNLRSVAEALRRRFPEVHLIICGDDDA